MGDTSNQKRKDVDRPRDVRSKGVTEMDGGRYVVEDRGEKVDEWLGNGHLER